MFGFRGKARKEIETYKKILEDRDQSIRELVTEIRRLELIIDQKDKELDETFEEKEHFESESTRLEHDNIGLLKEVKHLNDTIDGLESELDYLVKEIEVMENELAKEREKNLWD